MSVPGLVSAWLAAHQRYGKLKLAQVFHPAIDLARDGWPISHRQAESIATEPTLMEIPSSREIFGPAGRPLRAGEICVNPDLARTFERIIANGANEFYRGETAQLIAKCSETYGGHLSASDLEEHRMRWQPAISTSYRGRIVYEAPPNSSGHVLLQELNLAELFDLAALGYNTPGERALDGRGEEAGIRRPRAVPGRSRVVRGADRRTALEGVRERAGEPNRYEHRRDRRTGRRPLEMAGRR